MRLLGPADIARSLPMRVAIDAMRAAFSAHAEGEVTAPPRAVLRTGGKRGATLVMPAALETGEPPLLTVKVVSVFPDNPSGEVPSIHSTLIAVDAANGIPLALLDGTSLTAIRTAAACGLATDLLARPDSAVLAVFGSGVHARTQVRAVRAVRPIEEVRVFNPNSESARSMVSELGAVASDGARIRCADSSADALRGAHIACAATTSRTPVFEDVDVPDGIHINAIGSFLPEEREVPGETIARARVVVDDRHAALEEAGDLLIPMGEGLIGADHVRCDLGSLVLGRAQGRASSSEVTLFKAVGLAVQDVFAAHAVLREARRLDLGERIEW